MSYATRSTGTAVEGFRKRYPLPYTRRYDRLSRIEKHLRVSQGGPDSDIRRVAELRLLRLLGAVVLLVEAPAPTRAEFANHALARQGLTDAMSALWPRAVAIAVGVIGRRALPVSPVLAKLAKHPVVPVLDSIAGDPGGDRKVCLAVHTP